MWSHLHTRVAAVVAAIAAFGGLIALVWPRGPTPPAEVRQGPGAPGAAREGAAVVAAATGVERAAGTRWVKVRPGDPLRAADSIRTSAAGTAELALGHGTTVTVAERSELTIRELSAAIQRIGIVRGRVGIALHPDGLRLLRVEDRSGTIFASASGGRWHVAASPRGLGVAAESGDVRVESGGAAVDLSGGRESAAWRGATPLPPAPIPRGLALRLAPEIEARRANACAVFQTDVASEVTVNGELADVRADGSVTVLVPPRSRRSADVVVRHATGLVERKTIPCRDGGAEVRGARVRKGR